MMGWSEQKRTVERHSAAVSEARHRVIVGRHALARQFRVTLSKPETLAWLFATGTLVGARGGGDNGPHEHDGDRKRQSPASKLMSLSLWLGNMYRIASMHDNPPGPGAD